MTSRLLLDPCRLNYLGIMIWLIWWYVELERRLLVARHHLQERLSLILSPLGPSLMLEIMVSALHLPPVISYLGSGVKAELQLLSFLKLYHIVKVKLKDWLNNWSIINCTIMVLATKVIVFW